MSKRGFGGAGGRRIRTRDDDGAQDGAGELRGAEDEDLRAKVGEGDEVGHHGHVVDAVT